MALIVPMEVYHSRDIKGLCITNINGPFTPDEQYTAAKLVKHEYFHGNTVVIVPEEVGVDGQ